MISIHSHKRYYRWRSIISVVLLWILPVIACRTSSPPSKSIQQISEMDLVGIWESHYSSWKGVELLVIKDDGTYQQIYEDSKGYLYISEIEKWHLEPQNSGRLFLRFVKGRYFPEGPNWASLLGTDPLHPNLLYSYFDPKDNSAIVMDNELLLEVDLSKYSEITLMQFPSDIDAGSERFTLFKP